MISFKSELIIIFLIVSLFEKSFSVIKETNKLTIDSEALEKEKCLNSIADVFKVVRDIIIIIQNAELGENFEPNIIKAIHNKKTGEYDVYANIYNLHFEPNIIKAIQNAELGENHVHAIINALQKVECGENFEPNIIKAIPIRSLAAYAFKHLEVDGMEESYGKSYYLKLDNFLVEGSVNTPETYCEKYLASYYCIYNLFTNKYEQCKTDLQKVGFTSAQKIIDIIKLVFTHKINDSKNPDVKKYLTHIIENFDLKSDVISPTEYCTNSENLNLQSAHFD